MPQGDIRRLARTLIDLGVDLVHGHSSHHIQGIELYKGKPIFYGCGDFVDDYAVDTKYRNDLGFLFRLEYEVDETEQSRAREERAHQGLASIPEQVSHFFKSNSGRIQILLSYMY